MPKSHSGTLQRLDLLSLWPSPRCLTLVVSLMEFVEAGSVQAERSRDDIRLIWEMAELLPVILNYMELHTWGRSDLKGVNFL